MWELYQRGEKVELVGKVTGAFTTSAGCLKIKFPRILAIYPQYDQTKECWLPLM